MNFEVVTFSKKFAPIYVYYKNGEEEPVPIYCNSGDQPDADEVCVALKRMMFVLSFHPRHSDLKHVRKEVIQLS